MPLSNALDVVFVALAVLTLAAVVTAVFMPVQKRKKLLNWIGRKWII